MVRVFPSRESLTVRDGWQSHPEGYEPPGMEMYRGAKFQTSSHGTAALPLVCARPHETHSVGIFYGHNPMKFSFNVILVDVVVMIFIIRTVRFLLRPLREPRFVCELISAIIIGPSVLGRSQAFTALMFPLYSQFVVRNVGVMGFMLFLFISGVKMDMSLVQRSEKKYFYIGIISVLLPLVTVTVVGMATRHTWVDRDLARFSSIGGVAGSVAVTGFPIHYYVLQELNLLSSEVGNMALSIALVSDGIGFNIVLIFEAMKQADGSIEAALWYVFSSVAFITFMVIAVRRSMVWIIERTPDGEAVDQVYVVLILLSVFASGFLTDLLGIAIANGPFALGLVIPDGPPLGKTLVERSEALIMDVFMPFTFLFIGLSTDMHSMTEAGWAVLGPLFIMVVTGYVSKFVATLLSAYTVAVPLRDCLALSLVLSLRGQVELLLYIHWVDKNMIKVEGFALMVLLTTLSTGTLAPVISILYDPSKPFMVNKRRTIQHTPPDAELRFLLCVQDKESVPSFVNLLEVSYPTVTSPFKVHALHLVELIGRANPLIIDHDLEKLEDHPTVKVQDSEAIQNALKLYQERREECVKLHLYTALVPKRTMYQDVCKLALANKVAIIVLPLAKEGVIGDVGTEQWTAAVQPLSTIDVLANAPCSVGVLVDKAHRWNLATSRSFRGALHNFIVLFLGGADAREALAYADRMIGNPNVSLTVIRFLSANSEGDDEREKKLDDGVVTWFWVKNEANERVIYREVVVRNGAETVSAIQAMTEENYYHLWIMGRKQGINPRLVEGLSTWTENQEELGIIGDYVSCADFTAAESVLVLQQQVLIGSVPNITPPSTSFLRRWFS